MSFSHGSRAKLNRHSLPRFAGASLFDRVAQVVCEAECLPRKELYESWEFARRVRRKMRGRRIVDMASGHGLVTLILLLLDDSTPDAVAVDIRIPPSAVKLRDRFVAQWPRLTGRVSFVEGSLHDVAVTSEDHIVSAHACGSLTDDVLSCALLARASVAVLPCCQAEAKNDSAGLLGWMDCSLAIDVARAQRMRAAGYQIYTQTIPETITPKNRLLIAMAQPSPSPVPLR